LYDIDPKRRQNCGYEGKLYRWSLPPEVAAIVFGASTGELLRPVQIEDNHHVILVDQLTDANLSDEIRTEILDNLFDEWIQGELNYLINH
jgi:parvulin-like peptidyl-prolyl isomerase